MSILAAKVNVESVDNLNRPFYTNIVTELLIKRNILKYL